MSDHCAVLGLGFVGTTTALGLCHYGYRVHGYDADAARRATLEAGQLPFREPGLDLALREHLNTRFFVTDDVATCVREADVVFLCVGTPCDAQGALDYRQLFDAIDSCAGQLDDGVLLVVRSTVVPSSTRDVLAPRVRDRIGRECHTVVNPEFLREGSAWLDFIRPSRIVIGTDEPEAARRMESLYARFEVPCHVVDTVTAELIKYASNGLLATLISYSNEIQMLAQALGTADIPSIFRILHTDMRWSGNPAGMTQYLFPGCGFGGYCLPKDVLALTHLGRSRDVPLRILESALAVNEDVQRAAARRILSTWQPGQSLGLLGLSFKPGSDDVRGSPAANILEMLIAERPHETIVVHDPVANAAFRSAYGLPVEYSESVGDLLERAGVLAIVTAWPEFAAALQNADRPVVDLRYLLA